MIHATKANMPHAYKYPKSAASSLILAAQTSLNVVVAVALVVIFVAATIAFYL